MTSQITFGVRNPSFDPTRADVIDQLARIRMSPQETKVFLAILSQQVDLYERQVAPIAVPPQVFRELGLEP